jgi:hypothetical protein
MIRRVSVGVMSVGRSSSFPFVEDGAGTDQVDELWCVRAPAGPCGLDDLVGHDNSGCA